jgi:trehalose 6-phosphate phosphatase
MTVPPPTPNSALNVPASVPIAASRKSLGDMAGILRTVPAPTAETLAAALRPVTANPSRAAILCDIDGTLAPIVTRAEEAHVSDTVSRLLGRAARRYGLVACISGRSAADARRLVGVGGIAYAGSHGAELLEPGATRARISPAFESWSERVESFVSERDDAELRRLRVRIERKGPIVAFHWRGVPDEDAARTRLEGIAREAEAEGLDFHWGRKVLEVRPPVPVDKGQAVRELVERSGVRAALFGGDDATDLDAYAALDALVSEGVLDGAVKVGIASNEGPAAIVDQADQVVEGTDGFVAVLEALVDE